MKKKVILVLATGFGLGLSPVASGTVGTLLGVGIVVCLGLVGLAWYWQAALAVVMVVMAIPICGVAEAYLGKKDDGRIVADEYLTFPLCVLGLPWIDNWWLLGVAFVTHRLLDIIKPPPARQIQEIHGGVGIVMDDVVSSLYALGVNHVIWQICSRFMSS